MNVLKRLFKIGQAETHSAIDKLEDPIKMIEQGLRDMREDQDRALKALAEVKAMHIKRMRELKDSISQEEDLQNKSVLLLKKAHSGEMDTIEAEGFVKENLRRKSKLSQDIKIQTEDVNNLEKQVATLEQNVNRIKAGIKQWENELATLKARIKVSSATQKINKQMTNMDSTSVVSMLERMKDRVVQDEALAQAYGEMAESSISHDEKVKKALEDISVEDELARMKKNLGLSGTDVSDDKV
ncbi:PspA/IM30 family protein [Mongoliitalea daihaiensis]|uniref:PspA/IM30 family protein n=1 Tax=Mongoliitalea daihaiensis TaxID=2782006 RepID=UPI001F1A5297|nr:PspA/IM30 family protein [Mongoliitalea daihaiensis]UJP66060.1 PspA/IM30 family protein [Mongoliitalea daihaiensis]